MSAARARSRAEKASDCIASTSGTTLCRLMSMCSIVCCRSSCLVGFHSDMTSSPVARVWPTGGGRRSRLTTAVTVESRNFTAQEGNSNAAALRDQTLSQEMHSASDRLPAIRWE